MVVSSGAPEPDAHRDRPLPDFVVYLLGRDPNITDWPSRWVRWPDFPLRHSIEDAIDEIREAHRRAASQRVEIACGVGIGIGIGSHDFPSAGPYRSFRTAQAVAPVPITTATVPATCHAG